MSEFDAVDGSHPPASCCQNATGVAERLESAYGYKQTCSRLRATSGLPPGADSGPGHGGAVSRPPAG